VGKIVVDRLVCMGEGGGDGNQVREIDGPVNRRLVCCCK